MILAVRAHGERSEAAASDLVRLAWMTAALSRVERMPALDTLIHPAARPSEAELAERRAEHAELLALEANAQWN